MKTPVTLLTGLTVLALGSASVLAQSVDYKTAKGIIERTLGGEQTGQQAMEVSVVVYSPQGGNPIQRAAHLNFFTGERFKLKIRASHSGNLSVTNIEQSGKINVLSAAQVQAGVETLYPAEAHKFLEFDRSSGDETLRIVLTPMSQGASPPQDYAPPRQNDYGMPCPPACPVPSNQQQNSADALYGNTYGKAFVTGKGIREVVLEPNCPTCPTQFVQPVNGGGLFHEMKIKHY